MTGPDLATQTATNPFVGPLPIRPPQEIFGRDREIDELYYLLSAERIVLLYSPSGAGKSSLIEAGLMPRLAARFDVWGPTRVNLQPVDIDSAGINRYVRSANLGFEAGIPSERRRPTERISGMTLSEYFKGRPRRRSAPPNVVVLFDQFEELITVDPLAFAAKHEFFAQVGKLLQDPQVWALFALREDYLASLDPYAEQVPTFLKNRFRLDLLDRNAAQEAISRSVEEGGRRFAPEAVGKLVNDLATMQVQRPDGTFESQTGPNVEPLHLQVACRGLWERLPEDRRTIDLNDIQSFGDVTQALAEYYEKEIAEIAGGDQRVERAIREWIGGKLITPDGIRGQVLKGAGESEGLDNELIGRLVDTHLVRGEQRAGAVWYELSHDRLVEPVRTNNKEWFEAHLSKVQKVAAVWEAQARPDGLLLLDADLVEANQWAAVNESSLTGIERRFLKTSEAKQGAIWREQRQAKWLRLALGLAIMLLLAALSATWWALWAAKRARTAEAQARHNAEIALARQLAGASAVLGTEYRTDLEPAALIAIESLVRLHGFESDHAVRESTKLLAHQVVRFARYGVNVTNLVAFSPDGRWLAAPSPTNTVQVFEVPTGKEVSLSGTFRGPIVSLAFSPDGYWFVVGSNDNTARVFEVASWKEARSLPHQGRVRAVAFSADGRWLATGSDDTTARVFEVASWKEVRSLRHDGPVGAATFSADGRWLATGSDDTTARVFEVASGKEVSRVTHQGRIHQVAISADGRWVATVSVDARVFEAASGKDIPQLANLPLVLSLAFSPDGRWLATAGQDNYARVFEVASGKEVSHLFHQGQVCTVAFSADGRWVATASVDGTARVFEAASGKEVTRVTHRGMVRAAAFSKDGRWVATVADSEERVFEALGGQEVFVPSAKPLPGSVAFSADGRQVAAAFADNTVQLFETVSWKETLHLTNRPAVLAVAFSPDGHQVATASADNTVRLFDTASGKNFLSLTCQGPAHGLGFSPDGRRIAINGYGGEFDAVSGRKVSTLPYPGGDALAFSPDGRWIAVGNYLFPNAKVFDAKGWPKGNFSLKGRGSVSAVAFSPEGRWVVAGSDDHTARVFESASGKEVIDLPQQETVRAVAFSEDGSWIATGSDDHTARVFEAASGNEVSRMTLSGPVMAVHFTGDGRYLMTASEATSPQGLILTRHVLRAQDLIEDACSRLTRNLTNAEWIQYIGPDVPYHKTCPNLPDGEGVPSKEKATAAPGLGQARK